MKVISGKYLPVKLPIIQMAVIWLYLDRYHAPGWVHGMVWTIYGLFLGISFYALWNQDQVHPSKV